MTESSQGRPEGLPDRQLADARRDPRLAHGREAVVADWWAAMGAAERVRTLADWGIHELVARVGAPALPNKRIGRCVGTYNVAPGLTVESTNGWRDAADASGTRVSRTRPRCVSSSFLLPFRGVPSRGVAPGEQTPRSLKDTSRNHEPSTRDNELRLAGFSCHHLWWWCLQKPTAAAGGVADLPGRTQAGRSYLPRRGGRGGGGVGGRWGRSGSHR
jgi:hypothetical protein